MSTEENFPIRREEAKVKTSSAVWLAGADGTCALLCSFIEGATLNSFFTYQLHLDPWISALVWILFGIWNAINDPIYGYIADHTKSKLGRRIPWIRYGAPLYGLFFALCWLYFPSMSGNQVFLGIFFGVSLFFFDILYTAVASAIYVMPYEMAVTNKARSKIFIWKIVFSLISTGVPMVFNSNYSNMIAALGAQNFCFMMMGVGVVGAVIIFFSTFFYKENGYIKEEKQPSFLEGIKQTFTNKSFLIFEVISWTVIYAQTVLMNGLTPVWPMWETTWNLPIAPLLLCGGIMAVGAVVSLVLMAKFRDKFGVRNLAIVAMGCMSFGCLLGAFTGQFFYPLLITFLMVGVGFAGGMYLVPIINGDVIDKDEMDHGSRREGVYAGVNSLITKPASSIAIAFFNLMFAGFGFDDELLDASGNTDWVNQSQSAKDGVFMTWFLIAGILCGLSAIAMVFYPLHGQEWETAKANLAVTHAEKEEKYEQEMLAKIAQEKGE